MSKKVDRREFMKIGGLAGFIAVIFGAGIKVANAVDEPEEIVVAQGYYHGYYISVLPFSGPGYRIAPSALHNFRAIHRGDILTSHGISRIFG